jgi:hypothetical protein
MSDLLFLSVEVERVSGSRYCRRDLFRDFKKISRPVYLCLAMIVAEEKRTIEKLFEQSKGVE